MRLRSRWRWVVPVLLLAAAGLLPAAAPSAGAADVPRPTPRFNEDVPREHWINDAFQQLWQLGIGSPPPQGTLQGLKAFTWRELLSALVDAVQVGRRLSEEGLPDAHLLRLSEDAYRTPGKIAAELEPELRAMQLDTTGFRRDLEDLTRVLRVRWPNGVRTPFAPTYGRYDEEAWAAGTAQAAQEWKRGEALFYITRKPPAWLELNDGVRFLTPTGRFASAYSRDQFIAGHNEALWRSLKTAGPRRDLPWLPSVLDLAATWRRDGRKSIRLDRFHPGTPFSGADARVLWLPPDGDEDQGFERPPLLLADSRLRAAQPEPPPGECLVFQRFPWGETLLSVPTFPPPSGALDLLWGPPESGIVFFRTGVNDPEKPVRLYAVELQTGALLNAGAFTDIETRPATH